MLKNIHPDIIRVIESRPESSYLTSLKGLLVNFTGDSSHLRDSHLHTNSRKYHLPYGGFGTVEIAVFKIFQHLGLQPEAIEKSTTKDTFIIGDSYMYTTFKRQKIVRTVDDISVDGFTPIGIAVHTGAHYVAYSLENNIAYFYNDSGFIHSSEQIGNKLSNINNFTKIRPNYEVVVFYIRN